MRTRLPRARTYYAGDDPGQIVAALAHVSELLEVVMPFLGAAPGPSRIDRHTQEIVIARMSAVAGYRYWVRVHTVVALDAGLSGDQVVALRVERPVDGAFTNARELALIDWSTSSLAADRSPTPPAPDSPTTRSSC